MYGGPSPSPSRSFQRQERIKVFSNSQQAWLDGLVEEVAFTDCIMDGYSIPAGALKVSSPAGVKWIMPEQVAAAVRKIEEPLARTSGSPWPESPGEPLAAGRRAGYEAAARPPPAVPPGTALCKNGCGRPVQPGLTRGLKAYDTCCKRCAQEPGKNLHDENCGGQRSKDARRTTRSSSALLGAAVNVNAKSLLEEWIQAESPALPRLVGKILDNLRITGDQLDKEQIVRCFAELGNQFGDPILLSDDEFKAVLNRHGGRSGACPRDNFLAFTREILIQRYGIWFPEVLRVSTENFVQRNSRPLEHVYNLGKKLGEGSFGSVYSVEHKISGEVRVCKRISKTRSDVPESTILQEIGNMAMLDHPNVIKVYEYFNDAEFVSQIMEPCNGGELQDRIDDVFRHRRAERYDEAFMRDIMKQTLRALAFMHKQRFAHKDLKPQNIMLTDKASTSIKIIDFGLAELFNPHQDAANFVGGTLLYMSPQCFAGTMFLKCDIWSAGVVLYNLICGAMPFCAQWPPPPGRDQKWWEQETIKIIRDQPMKPLPAHFQVSRECRDLLDQMLMKDGERRPDAAKCLEHPWFRVGAEVPPTLSVGVAQCLECYSRMSELKKAIFLLMAHQSASPGLQELRAIFTHFDERNEGTLRADDLRGVLNDSGMKPLVADRVVHALDRDGNGAIGWTEFTAAAFCVSVCKKTELIDAAFAHFDSDSDGKIDCEDLERVLASDRREKERWHRRLPQLLEQMGPSSPSPGGTGGMGFLDGLFRRGSTSSSPSGGVVITREKFRAYVSSNLEIQGGHLFFAVS